MTAPDILRTHYCRLIGQMRRVITSRYVHAADAVLLATADAFSATRQSSRASRSRPEPSWNA
jgi:hypothetical protein